MAIQTTKVPLTNMSFTPDVPSSALQPNEYNQGLNIETDNRSIRAVTGESEILDQITGNAVFVTSGFRNNDVFWFIAATREGEWYGVNASGVTTLTPSGVGDFSGYSDDIAITADWNGDILFVNDTQNPPMYLLPGETEFRLYDNAPDNYIWNYNASWTALRAGFMRLFAAPNVGSILIAGNLQADTTSNTVVNLSSTVRWSQSFGLNSGPTTWAPTLTNVANELEVPVRGPVIDGFALNGNFYVMSYWDTVAFSPIAYQNSTAPLFGVKLLSKGRGLLNENCYCVVDNVAYGLDARDIWAFSNGQFVDIANQRTRDYFYNNLNPTYSHRTFMIHNTNKNQVEIYYPDLNSTGYCNRMLAYKYDLKVWNAPREIANAIQATETPLWSGNTYNLATRTVAYVQGNVANSQIIMQDTTTTFAGNANITTLFQRDNISFGQPYSAKVQVHRILPEITGTGNVNISVGGSESVGTAIAYQPTVEFDIDGSNPWAQIDQNDSRVVSIKIESNSNVGGYTLSSINWQVSVIEDDR